MGEKKFFASGVQRQVELDWCWVFKRGKKVSFFSPIEQRQKEETVLHNFKPECMLVGLDCIQCTVHVKMPTHVFQWTHGGSSVYVTGSFNYWARKERMADVGGGVFEFEKRLANAHYVYAFIVDGSWRHAPELPTIAAPDGMLNALYLASSTLGVLPLSSDVSSMLSGLPRGPVEPPDIRILEDRAASLLLGCRVAAPPTPALTDLSVRQLQSIAVPGRPYRFVVAAKPLRPWESSFGAAGFVGSVTSAL